MKPVAFAYHRATSLEDALDWLNHHPEGKVLAGGQSLIPLMNFRLSRPQELIDINGIAELAFVEHKEQTLHIGGLIHHQELHEHALVRDVFPVLAEAAGHVGHWAIRNRGTLGGSLVHADPASELPAVMVALQATFALASVDGVRKIPAEEFYLGYLTTDIQPNELLVNVEIPVRGDSSFGFSEFARRPGDFALAGAIVELQAAKSGAITWFGVGSAPLRASVEFPNSEAERSQVFENLLGTFDVIEEGPYRQQLAVAAAEQAYIRAMGRVVV